MGLTNQTTKSHKPSCSSSLGAFGAATLGSAMTVGAVIGAVYLGPEEFVGVEAIMSWSHIGPVGAAAFSATLLTGEQAYNDCF